MSPVTSDKVWRIGVLLCFFFKIFILVSRLHGIRESPHSVATVAVEYVTLCCRRTWGYVPSGERRVGGLLCSNVLNFFFFFSGFGDP